jgi:cyanophycin synthetase
VLSAEDAWAAACEIGGAPVVVKPQDGNQGKGVAVNLSTREQIEAAYAIAEVSDEVLVERYLPGHDYRLLVVGDKLIAAARRDPPLVIGDGVHSIRQLVERVNSDPRRGEGHATSLTRIRLDEVALARLTPMPA